MRKTVSFYEPGTRVFFIKRDMLAFEDEVGESEIATVCVGEIGDRHIRSGIYTIERYDSRIADFINDPKRQLFRGGVAIVLCENQIYEDAKNAFVRAIELNSEEKKRVAKKIEKLFADQEALDNTIEYQKKFFDAQEKRLEKIKEKKPAKVAYTEGE